MLISNIIVYEFYNSNSPPSIRNPRRDSSEIIKPAIARPRGRLPIPTIENINPSSHKIKPMKTVQDNSPANSDMTNPAMPTPFVLL